MTLAEGLTSVKNREEVSMLPPGKKALVTDDCTEVKEAGIAIVTAWKNGMFQFSSANIETIVRHIARRYDVDMK